jgi:hypothetical protein
MIGNLVAGRAASVRRAVAEGHTIGSHSFTHDHFNDKPDTTKLRKELNETVSVIESTVPGYKVTLHRPPYGELNSFVLQTVRSANLIPILWNGDTEDWSKDASIIKKKVDGMTTKFDPSSNSWIVLLHLIEETMVCGLTAVIRSIAARGYRFVSIDECINGRPAGSVPYILARRGPADSNSTACKHPPTSCTDGDDCGPTVTCCQPSACCTPYGDSRPGGYCVGPADDNLKPNDLANACNATCLSGACFECGDPMVLHAAVDPNHSSQESDYACPYVPPPFWTRTVIVLFAVIGLAAISGVGYAIKLHRSADENPAVKTKPKPVVRPPPPSAYDLNFV